MGIVVLAFGMILGAFVGLVVAFVSLTFGFVPYVDTKYLIIFMAVEVVTTVTGGILTSIFLGGNQSGQ